MIGMPGTSITSAEAGKTPISRLSEQRVLEGIRRYDAVKDVTNLKKAEAEAELAIKQRELVETDMARIEQMTATKAQAQEVAKAELETEISKKHLTTQAVKEAMKRTMFDNVKWVLGSRPMMALVAFPIAAGIGMLVGYVIFQTLMSMIASDIGKSLGVDEQTANYIMWIIGVIVFIVALVLLWNYMGKADYAKGGGK